MEYSGMSNNCWNSKFDEVLYVCVCIYIYTHIYVCMYVYVFYEELWSKAILRETSWESTLGCLVWEDLWTSWCFSFGKENLLGWAESTAGSWDERIGLWAPSWGRAGPVCWTDEGQCHWTIASNRAFQNSWFFQLLANVYSGKTFFRSAVLKAVPLCFSHCMREWRLSEALPLLGKISPNLTFFIWMFLT